MALPSIGSISMSQVRTELGRSNTITLNDSDVRNLAGRTSGTISMSDLRGKSSSTHKLTIGTASRKGATFYGYNTINFTGSTYGNLSPNTFNSKTVDCLYSEYNTSSPSYYTYLLSVWGALGVSKLTLIINNITVQLEGNSGNSSVIYSVYDDSVQYGTKVKDIYTYLKNNSGKTVGIIVKL